MKTLSRDELQRVLGGSGGDSGAGDPAVTGGIFHDDAGGNIGADAIA
ncbi:MAG: hypothetical protein MUF78_04090 [Candidatus Edwardsbacteria bacterium]|jgi:hypothetical protein|nr:hypothetical protein [Candidatus Edwardsbacteria bacterium]